MPPGSLTDLLANLPARGAFAAPTPGAVVAAPPVPYVCAHDTAPPEGQVVTTDPTNILIRTLLLKKANDAKARAGARAKGGSGGGGEAAAPAAAAGRAGAKRPGEAAADAPAPKRAAGGRVGADEAGPSGAGGGGGGGGAAPVARATRAELQALTLATLKERAKAAGLRVGGTKGDLVERLLLAMPAGGGG